MTLPENTVKLVEEMIGEMNSITSSRAESLLLTNLVEVIIKDCVEKLIGTEKARDIARTTIVKILEDRNVITPEGAHDINQIFEIRDAYAHKISLSEADEKAEQIMKNMKIVKMKASKDWWKGNTAKKIFDTADWFVFSLTQAYNAIK